MHEAWRAQEDRWVPGDVVELKFHSLSFAGPGAWRPRESAPMAVDYFVCLQSARRLTRASVVHASRAVPAMPFAPRHTPPADRPPLAHRKQRTASHTPRAARDLPRQSSVSTGTGAVQRWRSTLTPPEQ